jgi:hypothetical protein
LSRYSARETLDSLTIIEQVDPKATHADGSAAAAAAPQPLALAAQARAIIAVLV